MKKLTMSMKVVLISVISFLCVAGIVLGCVFAFRKNGAETPVVPEVENNSGKTDETQNGNSDNQNENTGDNSGEQGDNQGENSENQGENSENNSDKPEDIEPLPENLDENLSSKQIEMFEKINSSNVYHARVAQQIDLNSFVDAKGTKINLTDAYGYNDNYFMVPEYPYIMVKQQKENGDTYFAGLFDLYKLEEITNLYFCGMQDNSTANILLLYYCINKSSVFDFIDISDVDNISSIYKYSIEFDSAKTYDEIKNSEVVYNKGNFIYKFHFNGNVYSSLGIYSIKNSSEYSYNDIILDEENLEFGENSYYFIINNICYFGFNLEDKISVGTVTLSKNLNYEFSLTKDFLFIIEKGSSDLKRCYLISSFNFYKYASLENNIDITNDSNLSFINYIDINIKYDSLVCSQIEDFEYVSIYFHGKNSNSNLMIYFDNELNEIISYKAKSEDDKIVYSIGNKLLLKESGIKLVYNTNYIYNYFKFDDVSKFNISNEVIVYYSNDFSDFKVDKFYVNDNNIFLISNGNQNIFLDMNGELIYNFDFNSVVQYDDGYYYAKYNDENYIININDKTLVKIENFSTENDLIFFGIGYYFVDVKDENENVVSYKMFDYRGTSKYSEISKYSYKKIFGMTYISLERNDGEKYFYTYQFIVNSNISNYSDEVSTYVDYYDSEDFTNAVRFYFKTSASYKYLTSYDLTLDTARIGGTVYKGKASYNYSNGTLSYSNLSNVSSVDFAESMSFDSDGYCKACVRLWFDGSHQNPHYGAIVKRSGSASESSTYCYIKAYSFYTYNQYDGNIYCYNYPYCYTSTKYQGNKITFAANGTCVGADINGYTTLGGSKSSYVSSLGSGQVGYTDVRDGQNEISNDYFKNTYEKTYYTYACYTPHSCTIKLVYKNGNSDGSVSNTYGDWINISNPTRTGYTFNGWTITGLDSYNHYYSSSSYYYYSSDYYTSTTDTSLSNCKAIYYKWLNATNGSTIVFTAFWLKNYFTIVLDYNWNGYLNSYTTNNTNYIIKNRSSLKTNLYTNCSPTIYYHFIASYGYSNSDFYKYWVKTTNGAIFSSNNIFNSTDNIFNGGCTLVRLGYDFGGFYINKNKSSRVSGCDTAIDDTNWIQLIDSNGSFVSGQSGVGYIKEDYKNDEGDTIYLYAKWTKSTSNYKVEFVYNDANNSVYIKDGSNISQKTIQLIGSPSADVYVTVGETNKKINTRQANTVNTVYGIDAGILKTSVLDDTKNSQWDLYFNNRTTSGIIVKDTPYKLAGWIVGGENYTKGKYYYYEIKSAKNTGTTLSNYSKLNNIDGSYITLEEYLYYNSTAVDKIYLYAVYEIRSVEIGISAEKNINGSTPAQSNDLHVENKEVQYGISYNYKTATNFYNSTSDYTETIDTNFKNNYYDGVSPVTDNSNKPVVALGSKITFKVKVSDVGAVKKQINSSGVVTSTNASDSEIKAGNYGFDRLNYRISMVQFENFPYYDGSAYKLFSKLKLKFDESGYLIEIKAYYLGSDNKDVEITNLSSILQNYDSTNRVLKFKNKATFNIITINPIVNPVSGSLSNSYFDISVSNLYLANKSVAPTDQTTYIDGDKEFNVRFFATPIKEEIDEYKISYVNTYTASSALFNNSSGALPNGGYIAVPARRDGDKYKYWLNGKEFEVSALNTRFSKASLSGIEEMSFSHYVQVQQYGTASYMAYIYLNTTNVNNNIPAKDSTYGFNSLSDSSSYKKIRPNFGNSEIFFIEPAQSLVYGSVDNVNKLVSNEKYEPDSYLSSINFGGTIKNIGLDKTIITDTGNNFKYSNNNNPSITGINSYKVANFASDSTYFTSYKYNDVDYTVKEVYRFNNVAGNKTNYTLYLCYSANHKILYILTGNGNNTIKYSMNESKTIEFTMSPYNNNVKIEYKVNSNDRAPYKGNAITIVDSKNSVNGTITDGANDKVYTSNNWKPSSGAIYKIAPQDGYLINKITIKVGSSANSDEKTLMDYKLNNVDAEIKDIKMNSSDVQNTKVFSMFTGGISGTNDTRTVTLTYTGSDGYLESYNSTNKVGIYYGGRQGKTWGTLDSKFESVYLLITGVYDDVNVVVETISYLEFDFLDVDNLFNGESDFVNHISVASIGISGSTKNYKELNTGNAVNVNYNAGSFSKGFLCTTITGGYRLIYLGYAKEFEKGVAFFATDKNYAFYFTNARYYYDSNSTSNTNPFAISSDNGTVTTGDTIYKVGHEAKEDDVQCIFYEIYSPDDSSNSLKNHFTNTSSINDTQKVFITAQKWTILFDIKKNSSVMTSKSYLKKSTDTYANDGNKIVDNPTTKTGTWFNDTAITNINYIYPNSLNAESNTTVNWQNIDFKATAKINNVSIYDNNDVLASNDNNNKDITQINRNIYGYDVHIEYYSIPGYYLEKININSRTISNWFIQVNTNFKNSDEASNLSYKTKYGATCCFSYDPNNSKYDIYLYNCTINYTKTNPSDTTFNETFTLGETFNERKNNISILVDDFQIDLYSKAYKINVTFDPNVNDSNVSSYKSDSSKVNESSLQLTNNSGNLVKYNNSNKNSSAFVVEFGYDELKTFSTYATMTGYTFIGWGTNYYYEKDNGSQKARYSYSGDNQLNLWNTSCSWLDISSYFKYDARTDLKKLKEKKIKDTEGTYVNYYNSAFYIKDGYFVTDTGFSGSNKQNGQVQNYNFWSVYSNIFTIITKNDVKNFNSSNFIYDLKMYGIWKPNTYYVSLNLNDANLTGKDKNGSTVAQACKGNTAFEPITDNGIILPNSRKTDSKFNYGGSSYDLFVVFDTNHWYMLNKTNETYKWGTDNKINPLSIIDNNGLKYVDLFNDSSIVDFTEFIIDRFGYTWLGWFSDKLSNVFEENSYYSTMQTDYPLKKTGEVAGSTDKMAIWATTAYKSNSEFAKFDYKNYNSIFKNDPDKPNVHEISNDFHLNYYCDPNYNHNVKTNVQLFGKERDSSDGLYFYRYAKSGEFNEDYFNIFKNKTEFKNNIETTKKYYLTYFDTMLDYNYYMYHDEIGNDDNENDFIFFYNNSYTDVNFENKKVTTFRYVTLYAYWQTNLYDIQVNFRDNDSVNHVEIAGNMGNSSSSVIRTSKTFLPAYFDDTNLYSRLKTFLPVRVGYDFVGWTFNPNGGNYVVSPDSEVYKNYTYYEYDANTLAYVEKTKKVNYSLFLNDTLSNYLYTKHNNLWANYVCDSELANGDYLTNGNYNEVLGDKETYHRVYMFAVWSVQSFTINVSLNISGEHLSNLYDYDSEFALALYGLESTKDYVGQNTNYLKQDNSREFTFTDIAANAQFVVDFDGLLKDAKLIIRESLSDYTLKDLFATSAGYYFDGWSLKIDSSYNDIDGLASYYTIGEERYELFIEDDTDVSFYTNGDLISGTGKKVINEGTGETIYNNYEYSVNVIKNNNNTDKRFDVTMYQKVMSNVIVDFDYSSPNRDSIVTDEKKLSLRDYNDFKQQYGFNKVLVSDSSPYYDTILYSRNNSSNFGYVKVGDYKYYINVSYENDSYTMYFIDKAGNKTVIVPYIEDYDGNIAIANADKSDGTKPFTFDKNNFYYEKYIVNFDDTYDNDDTVGAYFVDKTYKRAFSDYNPNASDLSDRRTRLEIKFAVLTDDGSRPEIANISDYNITVKMNDVTYKLEKTRIFTVYAKWSLKTDLSISIVNENIGTGEDPSRDGFVIPSNKLDSFYSNQKESDNYGLAGYYYINKNNSSTYVNTASQTQSGIDLGYNFYDDLYLFISPYYNGRYLSKMSMTFYAYEQQENLKLSKVTYNLTLNFKWNSSNHIIEIETWSLTRDGSTKFNSSNDADNLLDTLSYNNEIGYYKNDLAVSNMSILSLLDQDVFDKSGVSKLIEISEYITGLIDYTNMNCYDPTVYYPNNSNYIYDELLGGRYVVNGNTIDGRSDVNFIKMRLMDAMSSVNISCEFSVQTYNLEVYNVFDSLGNTMTEENGIYTVNYKLKSFLLSSKSLMTSSGLNSYGITFPDTINQTYFLNGSVVATIPQKVGTEVFNVPYGYYIYGETYKASLRPVGVPYNAFTGEGYNTSAYTGYDYLYKYGIYKYGDTQELVKDNGIDVFSDQCSPILGSKVQFSKSVREASALYKFEGWFIPRVLDGDGKFNMIEYDGSHEATAITKNVTVIGYYYANNKPTSLQFFTWSDESNSHEVYKNNEEEYTLNSTKPVFKYNNNKIELSLSKDAKNYVDENGKMIFYTNESFGIDGAGFSSSKYTRSEIANKDVNKELLETNVIRGYWYYNRYEAFVNVTVNGVKHAIRYDDTGIIKEGTLLNFYYLSDENNLNSKKNYVQLFAASISEDVSEEIIIYVNVQTDNYIINLANGESLSDGEQRAKANYSGFSFALAKIEENYIYNMKGADMFAFEADPGGIDRYYRIKKIEDFVNDDELTDSEASLLRTFYNPDNKDKPYADTTARFYVKVHGTLYYLIATTPSLDYTASTFFKYEENKFETTGIDYTIIYDSTAEGYKHSVTINNKSQFVKPIADYSNDKTLLNQDERDKIKSILKIEGLQKPTYYTKETDSGTLYFLFDETLPEVSVERKLYLFMDKGFIRTSDALSITNLDYYYMRVNDEYFKVDYTVMSETNYLGNVTYYYNPYKTQNTTDYKIDYTVKYNAENEYKYTVNLNGRTQPIKPLSQYSTDDNMLLAEDRTEIQYMLSTSSVTPAYYTKDVVTRKILYLLSSTLPQNDFNTNLYVYENGEFVENTVRYYFNYTSRIFYTDEEMQNRLSTNDLSHKVYTPVNDNYSIKLALPDTSTNATDVWEYRGVTINSLPSQNTGFWYNGSGNYYLVGYVDFKVGDLSYLASTSAASTFNYDKEGEGENQVIVKQRIYDVFEEYINVVYSDKSETIRQAMLESVKNQCSDYESIDKIQELFITVDKFYTKTTSNSVEKVDLSIPITIELSYNEGGVLKKESKTVSVRYKTTIITKATTIDETIYAIPVYSRVAMEFTDNSVEKPSTTSTVIKITPKKMFVNFFQIIGNIDTRYYNSNNGNYLEYAILGSEEMKLLMKEDNISDGLTRLMTEKNPDETNKYNIEILTETRTTTTLSADFGSYDNGKYYIIAYYKKMDDYNYVIKKSDNIVEVTVDGGEFKEISYSIINYSDMQNNTQN